MTELVAIFGAALAVVFGLWRSSVQAQRKAESDAALNKSRWQNEMARSRRVEELAKSRQKIDDKTRVEAEAVQVSVEEARRVHGAKTAAIAGDDLAGLARRLNGGDK